MLKSFSQFISESENPEKDFINTTARQLIQKIKSIDESDEYTSLAGMEFTEPIRFDLILNVKKKKDVKISEDPHFESLSWEQINYDKLGYAIDANVRTNSGDLLIPEIEIHIILDPNKIPHAYTNLYARLVDILTHETAHISQFDPLDRNPFSSHTSSKEERNSAKKNFKYFLLNDEVEAMVDGMYANAKTKEIPLDHVFHDYLMPFIQSKYITPEEYAEVLSVWVKTALEKYPDAVFSKKVEKIVNSI